MSALDEIILSKKYGQSYTPLESVLMVHKKRYPNDAESAAAELLALRADLADAKARAKTAEENWHKNEARVAKLENIRECARKLIALRGVAHGEWVVEELEVALKSQ